MSCEVNWDRGISVVGHQLWLDPQVVRELAFVSHAHSDHARRHRRALLTEPTLSLLSKPRRPHDVEVVPVGQTVVVDGARVTLYDAGHMLGSAMLLFQQPGRSLLYTGDMKLLRPAGLSTPVPQAQALVMESTYGLPHFRFPEPDSVVQELALWCRQAIAAGATPVILAHALGKAQEVMLLLGRLGFRFALEERCLPFARGYEAAGVRLPEWAELSQVEERLEDRVVLLPPAGKQALRRLARYRTALVSGWAKDPQFSRLFGADSCFPLSDHCDFDELLEVVRLSGAEHVYTVHGYADELARHLRRRGVRAHALARTEQLALAI